MPIISFSVFKEKVKAGLEGKALPEAKRQTIRGLRKYPIKIDDRLYLWWKSRTPQREKLGESICEDAFNIEMTVTVESEDRVNGFSRFALKATMLDDTGSRREMSFAELTYLARMDGFDGITAMAKWFWETHGWFVNKPFQVIRWGKAVEPSSNPSNTIEGPKQ